MKTAVKTRKPREKTKNQEGCLVFDDLLPKLKNGKN